MRIVERIVDGPKCPNCHHDAAIHDEGKCLGAVFDRNGTHVRWCDCDTLDRKGK